MKKFIHKKLTNGEAREILKKWGNPSCYAENLHGAVYWNETGEILWLSEDGTNTNAELIIG
jgi:hypothetical protein